MDFVAIDFETANYRLSSICAVGIAVVRGGDVIERSSWLIRPPRLYFAPLHTSIHGIRKENVADKPTFDRFWPRLKAYLDGKIIIAHNASFDMGALRAVLDEYGIAYPELHYSCTCMIAKRAWPGLTSYSLDTVSRFLGITFKHHDAGEDAFACAQIAVQACKKLNTQCLNQLATRLGFANGRLFPGGYTPTQSLREGDSRGKNGAYPGRMYT